MKTPFQHRVGLIVWLYTTKYINKLKNYGLLHYVSSKMNYAVLYVDDHEVPKALEVLKRQHFVRDVVLGYQTDMPYTYDGLLETLNTKAKETNQISEQEAVDLFTQLTTDHITGTIADSLEDE